MARRTAISAMVAAMTLLASAACGGGGGAAKGSAGANPTLATDPPRTNPTLATVPAPTTTTNPYAVPATIDTSYVSRVITGLDAAMGDVTRLVVRTRTIPREAYDRMRAIYGTDDGLQLAIDTFQSDMRRNFSGYKPDPGNKSTTIIELITASKLCIFAKVSRDYSAVGTNARTADLQWIAIKPLQVTRDPQGYNATNWAFMYEGFPPDRTQPPNPCL